MNEHESLPPGYKSLMLKGILIVIALAGLFSWTQQEIFNHYAKIGECYKIRKDRGTIKIKEYVRDGYIVENVSPDKDKTEILRFWLDKGDLDIYYRKIDCPPESP